MPSGPLIRKNFEATTVLQLFEVVSDSFSIVSDEAHLAPEAVTAVPIILDPPTLKS